MHSTFHLPHIFSNVEKQNAVPSADWLLLVWESDDLADNMITDLTENKPWRPKAWLRFK